MNIDRLNININGAPSTGFSGDDSAFHEIASIIGEKLPQDYVELMKNADGGHPEINCFHPQGGDPNNLFEIDWFYSLNSPDAERAKDVLVNWRHLLGMRSLPIGRDGGGNQIYIDLSEGSSVWLFLHDENGMKIKISNSLAEFIDSLVTNPDLI